MSFLYIFFKIVIFPYYIIEIKLPNTQTLEVFKSTYEGKDLIPCDNAEDMFKS